MQIADAVHKLAAQTHGLADWELDQPWAWRFHKEGARFALIGTYTELMDLAISLERERETDGPERTLMQRALGRYNAGYRDLQALVLGLPDDVFEAKPGASEWPLRFILAHIIGAQRRFFTLITYGLRRRRNSSNAAGDAGLPLELPADETERVVGPYDDFRKLFATGAPPGPLLDYYAALHARTLEEFQGITDDETEAPTLWWEREELDLLFRMHRSDAHLRQHTVQIEKTLAAVGHAPSEAKVWLRHVYRALADVESACIGAPQLGDEARTRLATAISARADDVSAAIERAAALVAAAAAGDTAGIRRLADEAPAVVNAHSADSVSAVFAALYRGQREAAMTLVELGAQLGAHEAAALGRLDILAEEIEEEPELVNELSVDGYSLLQLAAFFGQGEAAEFLVANGADLELTASNGTDLRAIHSAAAGGEAAIVRLLLDHGADANTVQNGGFTPLHAAAQSGNLLMTQHFIDGNADIEARTDDGRTAFDFADAGGHGDVADLLRRAADSRDGVPADLK
jgi:uncharacterized protein